MQKWRTACLEILLATLLVVLNGWFVVRVVGVSYGPFDWAAFAAVYQAEADFLDGCTDGVDNDSNGQVDCADLSCRDDPACTAPAPILGAPGVALLGLVLLLVAAVALRRRPVNSNAGDS